MANLYQTNEIRVESKGFGTITGVEVTREVVYRVKFKTGTVPAAPMVFDIFSKDGTLLASFRSDISASSLFHNCQDVSFSTLGIK